MLNSYKEIFEELILRAKKEINFGQMIKSITAPEKFRFFLKIYKYKNIISNKNNT